MNKTELIAQVAEKTGTTRKDAEQVITTMLEVIGEELGCRRQSTAGWLWRI